MRHLISDFSELVNFLFLSTVLFALFVRCTEWEVSQSSRFALCCLMIQKINLSNKLDSTGKISCRAY